VIEVFLVILAINSHIMSVTRKFKFYYPTFLLFIPLVAKQFSNEVIWSPMDFVTMGTLLLFVGIGIEWVLKKAFPKKKTVIYIAAVAFVFLLLWIEIAVGVFGSPIAGN